MTQIPCYSRPFTTEHLNRSRENEANHASTYGDMVVQSNSIAVTTVEQTFRRTRPVAGRRSTGATPNEKGNSIRQLYSRLSSLNLAYPKVVKISRKYMTLAPIWS